MYTHFEALIESYLINEKHMRPRSAGDKVVIQTTPAIESGEQVWVVSTYGEMGRNKQVVVSVADILLFIANGSGSGTYSLRDDLAPTCLEQAIDDLRQHENALSNIRSYKDLLALDKRILVKLIEFERIQIDNYESSDRYMPSYDSGHHRDMYDIYNHAFAGDELPNSPYVCLDESGILEINILSIFDDGSESNCPSHSPSP